MTNPDERPTLIEREALAKRFDHAAWKGFTQTDSEFEKGYKHAMEVAARAVRETPPFVTPVEQEKAKAS